MNEPLAPPGGAKLFKVYSCYLQVSSINLLAVWVLFAWRYSNNSICPVSQRIKCVLVCNMTLPPIFQNIHSRISSVLDNRPVDMSRRVCDLTRAWVLIQKSCIYVFNPTPLV